MSKSCVQTLTLLYYVWKYKWMDIIRFHLVIFVIVVVCWFFLFLIINDIFIKQNRLLHAHDEEHTIN